MKQLIYHMAMILMTRNGSTTTLEVKNALRKTFESDQSFDLRQKEVSQTMEELYIEHEWDFNQSADGTHRVYTIPGAVGHDMDDNDLDDDLNSDADAGPSLDDPNIQANTVLNSSILDAQNMDDASLGLVVCYIRNRPDIFVRAHDRATARKQAFQKSIAAGHLVDYDDVNTCSTKFFVNKYM